MTKHNMTDFNTRQFCADTKFYNDYSRFLEEEDRYESWIESVDRVMGMHRTRYAKALEGNAELKKMFYDIQEGYEEKLFLGAQRALQFGGEQLLKNNARMYNCTATYANRIDFFGEFMWLLLSGAGVGVSIQERHTKSMPDLVIPSGARKTYVIEDSIEGWADASQVIIASFFAPSGGKFDNWSGKKVYLDYSKIRKKGSFISGGFKAPGPEPLRKALDIIEDKLVGMVREEERARGIEIYDICMYLADAVIAGGVRRSATIFLFDAWDQEMMEAKTGNWFIDNKQRARSNNSVVLHRTESPKEHFELVIKATKQFGEPGFVFVDDWDALSNPCVEIGLYAFLDEEKTLSGFQGCNLSEINGALCSTEQAFYRACRLASAIGTLQAGYTNFPYLTDVSRQIFEREALLGVSITGWMNNPEILFDERILKEGARIVKETNQQVAKMIGINPAARTTCTKPSGNASVVLMSASGIHQEHAPRYIRNTTYQEDSDILKLVQEKNPHMVERCGGQSNSYTISYPVTAPKTSIFRTDLGAEEFLEKVKTAYLHWVEEGNVEEYSYAKKVRHNISNTVTVKPEEWDMVSGYLWENKNYFSGVSFISSFGDKDFYQAPFTEVKTAEQITDEYGDGALFASGLIVDSVAGFDNLWSAIFMCKNYTEDQFKGESGDLQLRWYRRFHKFAETFFDGDLDKIDYCLKDVYLLHRWNKIEKNFEVIDFTKDLGQKEFVDIASLAAIACAGGACEI